MTVENTISKTAKQVMGAKTYDFSFDVLLKDPTDEAAQKAVKCAVSDGKHEAILIYGKDYTVELNKNRKGGRVTVVNPRDGSWTITIYRSYEAVQGADYNDFDAFPAETLEQCLDKHTMLIQELREGFSRCVKQNITSDHNPDELLEDFNNKLDIAADTLEKMTEQAGISQEGASKSESAANEAVKAADELKEMIEDGKIGRTNTVYQRNIGDLFYTHNMLKGTKASGSLNGAYQCNGDEFKASDFKGDSTPYDLLIAGKLPSVSYSKYAEIMADAGFCGYFALDTAAKKFKVPTITSQFLQAGTPGQLAKAGLPNITGNVINVMTYKGDQGASGALGITQTGSASTSSSGKTLSNTLTLDASRSNGIYGRSSTVQPAAVKARVMVQLANVIDNASSIESYIATLKDLKNESVSAIKVASGNALKEADTALADIESAKVAALGNVSTAQETAVNAVVGAQETAITNINELAEEINQTVANAEENIGELAALNERAEEKTEALNTAIATADTKITDLTALNNAAAETVENVNNAANRAETSATAAAADAQKVLTGAPQITVAESSDTVYTLKIKTLDDEFTSVNLRGPQGIQGQKGDKGDTGPQGPSGPAGMNGEKGDKGDKGEKGDVGPQGPQGDAGYITLTYWE